MVKFWHDLPREISIHTDRKQYIADYCRGRKVLHVGCTDAGLSRERINAQTHLHLRLLTCAERVWGLDVDEEGLEILRSMGIKDLFHANAEQLADLPLDDKPDLIVATEVLEHVSNPGLFLESLSRFGCEVVLTVPNAYSYRAIQVMQAGQELVHEDHNYYFSYVTLKKLIEKHGYRLNQAALYYWPSDDEVGRAAQLAMATNPFFAEGLIFSIMPTALEEEASSLMVQESPLKMAFFAGDVDNFTFLKEIIDHFREQGKDVRVIESEKLTPEQLFEHMQWSDVSWFEWGNGPLIVASQLPKVCKIVARIHRYEVFTETPKLIDWSKVDDLIFVSPHVLALFKERHFSDIESRTKVSIIHNAVDLRKLTPAFSARGFNIAYVNRINKDKNPTLLIQIMAELVKRDPRFKCFIAGSVQDEVIYRYMQQMIDVLGLREHIQFCGRISDINAWLDDKHFIFSTSVVEGHPVSVIEGMAKGLKPIIHNYLGDASSFVGGNHVYNTVNEAVALFMEEEYRPEAYRRVVEQQFSLEGQLQKIEAVVLGDMVSVASSPPVSRGFSILLEDGDENRLAQAITAYLQAFTPDDDVEMFVLASHGIEQTYGIVSKVLDQLGRDEVDIPDITLEENSSLKRASMLEHADLVIGSPEIVGEARDLGRPAMQLPSPESLRAASECFAQLDWNAASLPNSHMASERWLVSQPEAWRDVMPAFLSSVKAGNRISLLIRVVTGEAELALVEIGTWFQERGYAPDSLPDIVLFDNEVTSEVAVFRMATAWVDSGHVADRAIAEAVGLSIIPGTDVGMTTFLSQPFISVLIPTYNRAPFIEEAVRSARRQNYERFEILVIDDGSTDNTAELVSAMRDPRLQYMEKPHTGAPDTRNLALLQAGGDFVLWLGSDDVLEPNVLSDYVKVLRDTPNIDVLYGNLIITDAQLNPSQFLRYQDWSGRNAELVSRLLDHNQIPDGGSLVRKTCYDWAGGYDEAFRRAHDYEWWTRVAGQAKFKHVDRTVYRWRWHGGNMSSGTVKFDTRFDAAVVMCLVERYSLQELCPDLDWDGGPQAEVEARARLKIAMHLLRYGDLEGAREMTQLSLKSAPLPEAEEFALRLDS